jgi:hypothetical protein
MRDLANLAAGVQMALIGFFVAALFHPIAYQFYFFSVAGLAVALKNTCRAEIVQARAIRAAFTVTERSHPESRATLMCGGTENQFMTLGRRLDPRASSSSSPACAGGAGSSTSSWSAGFRCASTRSRRFRSVTAIVQQARLARHIVRRPDSHRSRIQLLRQRLRDSACAHGRAGGHRVDTRLRTVPDVDAEAGAAVCLSVCRLRARERRRGKGLAHRRRVRPLEDCGDPQRRRPVAL